MECHQEPAQFQGEGSSHELASLLLTECIQHSMFALNKPAYVLYLDARSAFDVVQRELLIKNLFIPGTHDPLLTYIDNRLNNRCTVLDWNGCLMGSINDQQGLEQGGCSSSDFYKIYAREQLRLAQRSELGVPLGPTIVSCIGQADDCVLISNDIHSLSCLLTLTSLFCSKYQVDLCSEKTRLQVYSRDTFSGTDEYNPISINGNVIPFSPEADHVGVLRSIDGNQPTLMARFKAHRCALASILFSGAAKNHRGNPAYSIRMERIYATPVLMSGLASLFLSRNDLVLIESHYCKTIRQLLCISEKTHRCVAYFLAGSLPGSAVIHLRQLGLFSMICRLKNSILHEHAVNYFSAVTISPKSWFTQIRDLCLMYRLPHPSIFLYSPLPKLEFKRLVKKRVIDYWEHQLRKEATELKSLKYFDPNFMSLVSPHPLWTTAGHSPSKVAMASVQASMLSGRYPIDKLTRHWSLKVTGYCTLHDNCSNMMEDICHVLQHCTALNVARLKLLDYTHSQIKDLPQILQNLACPRFTNFLLDCFSIP